jgi:hypothetical protein
MGRIRRWQTMPARRRRFETKTPVKTAGAAQRQHQLPDASAIFSFRFFYKVLFET